MFQTNQTTFATMWIVDAECTQISAISQFLKYDDYSNEFEFHKEQSYSILLTRIEHSVTTIEVFK